MKMRKIERVKILYIVFLIILFLELLEDIYWVLKEGAVLDLFRRPVESDNLTSDQTSLVFWKTFALYVKIKGSLILSALTS